MYMGFSVRVGGDRIIQYPNEYMKVFLLLFVAAATGTSSDRNGFMRRQPPNATKRATLINKVFRWFWL